MVVTRTEPESDFLGDIKKSGELIERMSASKLVVYGDSRPYGGGASDPDRDITTHLASMMKCREVARAFPGAVLHWHQQTILGDGGWAYVMQNEIRRQWPSTTLSAQATAGATTIAVTSGALIPNGTLLCVGIGAAGATGSEMLYVTAGGGTNTLTIRRPDGGTTTSRTHLNGEPVVAVPSGWLNLNPVYLLWWGGNDVAASPFTSPSNVNLNKRYTDPLRAVIARCRSAEVFEQDNAAFIYTGTWSAHTAGTATNSGSSYRSSTVVNSTATFHVPDNFEAGCTVNLGYVYGFSSPFIGTLEFRVDGTLVSTRVFSSSTECHPFTFKGCVERFTGLAAGRHAIEVKISSYTSGTFYLDWAGIEPAVPPITLIPGFHRPLLYTNWPNNATYLNGQTNRTLNGVHNAGSTTINLNSSTGALVGATITFEEGTGNAETREVLTVPGGTSVTVAATSLSHANGTAVTIGYQDADIPLGDALHQAVVNEFNLPTSPSGDRCIFVPIDDLINKNPLLHADNVHYNDKGHSVLTKRFYDKLQGAVAFSATTMAYTAVPTIPFPCQVPFLSAGVTNANTTWTDMPAAKTELFGATIGPGYRTRIDLSKVVWGRFVTFVRVAGASGSGLRLEYSADNGTTWVYLGKASSGASDGTVFECLLTSTGEKDTGWKALDPRACIESALLRVVGINGNATADPVFGVIYAAFR